MAYQFTQTGQEIQDILNQVPENTADIAQNTADISSLGTRMTTAEGDIDALETSVSHVGQYVTSNGGSASSISLPASTFTNVCSISLSAGKWIINGSCRFGNVAAGTRHASISTVSGTSQSIGAQQVYAIGSMFTLLNPTRMIQLSATTTVYLIVYSNIACTVDNAYLQALRVK